MVCARLVMAVWLRPGESNDLLSATTPPACVSALGLHNRKQQAAPQRRTEIHAWDGGLTGGIELAIGNPAFESAGRGSEALVAGS